VFATCRDTTQECCAPTKARRINAAGWSDRELDDGVGARGRSRRVRWFDVVGLSKVSISALAVANNIGAEAVRTVVSRR